MERRIEKEPLERSCTADEIQICIFSCMRWIVLFCESTIPSHKKHSWPIMKINNSSRHHSSSSNDTWHVDDFVVSNLHATSHVSATGNFIVHSSTQFGESCMWPSRKFKWEEREGYFGRSRGNGPSLKACCVCVWGGDSYGISSTQHNNNGHLN